MKTKSKTALSALDSFLSEIAEDGVKQDEFTAHMAYHEHRAAGGTRTLAGIRCLLKRRVDEGLLSSRTMVINGKVTAVYSLPEA